MAERIFLLSPAYAGGRRAQMILGKNAQIDLAKRLRSKRGASIAEVFTFLSGLYFRGKIAYASAFARCMNGTSGVFVITPTRGLVDAHARIRLNHLREFAETDIDENELLPQLRKQLSHFKVPHHVFAIEFHEIPRTHTGKISKRELRSLVLDRWDHLSVGGVRDSQPSR